jgi:hypothetical protein
MRAGVPIIASRTRHADSGDVAAAASVRPILSSMNDMNSDIASQTFSSATSVIALHCSGSGAAQWRKLGEALGLRHALVAPEHYG